MIGSKVDVEKFDYDEFEAEINGSPERRFDMVYDCMCGEYCVVGKILASGGSYRDESSTWVEINPDDLGVDREALAKVVSEAFGQNRCANDFKLIMFSHFS
jgi:hypothetical protein